MPTDSTDCDKADYDTETVCHSLADADVLPIGNQRYGNTENNTEAVSLPLGNAESLPLGHAESLPGGHASSIEVNGDGLRPTGDSLNPADKMVQWAVACLW